MFKITQKEIKKGLKEYQYFLIGHSGSFTTSLFEAIGHATTENLIRMANAYPEYVYAYLDNVGGLYRVPFQIESENK